MTQLSYYDWASVPLDLTWYNFFWTCPSPFNLVWPFCCWAFDSEIFPRNWFESTHYSSSTSGSWTDSTNDSNGFPGNWLTINSRLKWIPSTDSDRLMIQVAFQGIDSESIHDSSGSQVLIQINSWLKPKTFDSEATHDSTLSRTHAWTQPMGLYLLSVSALQGFVFGAIP